MSMLSKFGPVGRFLMFWKVLRDKSVPWWGKFLFVAVTLGYLANPIDLIPDVIIGIGWIDDLILMPVFAWVFGRFLPHLTGSQNNPPPPH